MTKTDREKIKWRSEIFKEHLKKVGLRLPVSTEYIPSIGQKIIVISRIPENYQLQAIGISPKI